MAYANAISDGSASSASAISTQPLVTPAPTYALAHDSQTVLTEGSTETFSIVTTGVNTGATLYYSLTGVTASEIVGGQLTGTVTVAANGDATAARNITTIQKLIDEVINQGRLDLYECYLAADRIDHETFGMPDGMTSGHEGFRRVTSYAAHRVLSKSKFRIAHFFGPGGATG